MNKWFKKQYRTDTDAQLDERDPSRNEPPPIDNDNENVAPATDRRHLPGPFPGGHRPLKGGYWFIREKYRNEIAAAIARDKEKAEETRYELELEQQERRCAAPQIQGNLLHNLLSAVTAHQCGRLPPSSTEYPLLEPFGPHMSTDQ